MQTDARKSPQTLLAEARAGLATALAATLDAVNQSNASPALIGQAMAGLLQAQQSYNNAVVKIPLSVMTATHEVISVAEPSDDAGRHLRPSPDAQAHPAASIDSPNPRVWADRFLAENRDNVVSRESLVHWFGWALSKGADVANLAHDIARD